MTVKSGTRGNIQCFYTFKQAHKSKLDNHIFLLKGLKRIDIRSLKTFTIKAYNDIFFFFFR